jgi:hypothetical protein
MSSKTISLSLPAYERLRHARRRPDESFSQVILRAEWPEDTMTGSELLKVMEDRGPAYEAGHLKSVEAAKAAVKPPEDKWTKR